MCKVLELAGAKVTGYSLKAPTNPSLFDIADIEKIWKIYYCRYKGFE